jgi:hypothetical protein
MSLYCDDCQADVSDECECCGCECCCDSPNAHNAAMEKQHAYWSAYFGQDRGTPEQKRRALAAMDPRPVSAEQMDEYRRLK